MGLPLWNGEAVKQGTVNDPFLVIPYKNDPNNLEFFPENSTLNYPPSLDKRLFLWYNTQGI